MKKKILALAAVCAVLAAAGCTNNGQAGGTTAAATTTTAATTTEAATEAPETTTTTEAETTTAAETEAPAADNAVMSYSEFIAADIDSPVTIETFIQAKQSWWENEGVGNASFYAVTPGDGGYFLYNMPCTKEEYDLLTPGTNVRVSGYKAEWSGEIEIIDSTFEILEGMAFTANAQDVTDLLGNEEALIQHQNDFVSFKGMTVEAYGEDGAVFNYKYDNSGTEGDDLYFKVSKDGNSYTFTVESYLCGPDTDVYQAVKSLNVGDVIDLEGFLYWYNGANPHITKITKA